ncbi:F-box protein At3g07870-like [Rhodamnia argentea]|uniref:F-box protein At3g07870-like n=1 Tax=Rhodamnia argentea TaxID=178133 RepID=A0A8B8PY48_9MYRT|nr:F-box protein At3g07870-like [Rhodamnia argentea]
MESEPDSGSQSKNGRRDRPRDHSPSPSQSHGVTIDTLPREIVIHILSILPTPSLFRAQFVCRSWRALARDPLLLQLHRPGAASSHDPSLVFHCDQPLRSQLYFVDDVSGGNGRNCRARKFHPPHSVIPPEFDVVGSSEGLLCLANALNSDEVYVYNPLTGEYRELPDSDACQWKQEMVLGFGFDVTEKDYKVIKIVYRITSRNHRVFLDNSEVQVCTLRSPTWRRLGNATRYLEATPTQPLVNRKLHWTASRVRRRTDRIVSFDLSDEKFRNVSEPECEDFWRSNLDLVELGGCLSAAVLSSSGALEIWVMKEYGMKESWIKDYSIGSYLPKGLQSHEHEETKDPSCKMSRILMRKRYGLYVRVLGMLRNGDILLEYHNRALVRYDPNCDKAVDLVFEGLPKWFDSIVYVSSISSV